MKSLAAFSDAQMCVNVLNVTAKGIQLASVTENVWTCLKVLLYKSDFDSSLFQAYLHSMSIIHRDLNSHNCLVKLVGVTWHLASHYPSLNPNNDNKGWELFVRFMN